MGRNVLDVLLVELWSLVVLFDAADGRELPNDDEER